MKINLKNPAHIKLLLLSNGVKFNNNDLDEVGEKYAENRYYYNTSNETTNFKNKLPSEILLPHNIETSLYYNNNSDFELKKRQNTFAIFYKKNLISKATLNKRPFFFNELISNNIHCNQAISMYGRYTLGIFSNAYCFFNQTNNQCKFCSLKHTRETTGENNLFKITAGLVKKALQIAVKTDKKRIKYIMHTCGTHHNENICYKEQIKIINTTKKIVDKNVTQHLTIMPTLNDQLIIGLMNSGLNSLAFDLEVFDKKLFSKYCPGKEKFFGYENFIDSFLLAKNIFGHSNIKAGFVGGLEPLESLEKGMHFFGQKGISIAINVFHPDKNTPLSNKQRPTSEYLFKMVKIQSRIYKKYNLKPVFPIGGRRSSLDSEVYKNLFD